MKVVLSTVGYGRSGGTESVARDLSWGLLRRGYDVTVLTETSIGDHAPLKITKDLNVLLTADVVIQVGIFSVMDYEVVNRKRHKVFKAPMLIWAIEPDLRLMQWCVDLQSGISHDNVILGYSVEYGRHRLAYLGIGNLGMKIRYGVPTVTGRPGFRNKRGITSPKMFLSSGGFDERKCQHELIKSFTDARIYDKTLYDVTLVITGHRGFHHTPKEVEGVRVIVPDDRQELMDAMFEADLYIMNSDSEGFGLVLLEAMFNKTRWASNKVGAAVHAEDLANFGWVYSDEVGLKRAFRDYGCLDVMSAYRFALANHRIECMVDDVEAAVKALMEKSGK